MLKELKLQEVRETLGKRGHDKTGLKLTLLNRLEEALINEGEDPETYEEGGMDEGAEGEIMRTQERLETENRDEKMMKFMETIMNRSMEKIKKKMEESRESIEKMEKKIDSLSKVVEKWFEDDDKIIQELKNRQDVTEVAFLTQEERMFDFQANLQEETRQ
ncbi:unnamed protein product [Psylliodes chrysocephalus]|uniref:SAP domain-containing protein n=1 Tax=Psylliodes chrysocephalus TaxID=3402493 RepID=A0A9P0D3A4_9CUCU|nr:unnamed protein product [Psylliodes chrysocephala]